MKIFTLHLFFFFYNKQVLLCWSVCGRGRLTIQGQGEIYTDYLVDTEAWPCPFQSKLIGYEARDRRTLRVSSSSGPKPCAHHFEMGLKLEERTWSLWPEFL